MERKAEERGKDGERKGIGEERDSVVLKDIFKCWEL